MFYMCGCPLRKRQRNQLQTHSVYNQRTHTHTHPTYAHTQTLLGFWLALAEPTASFL